MPRKLEAQWAHRVVVLHISGEPLLAVAALQTDRCLGGQPRTGEGPLLLAWAAPSRSLAEWVRRPRRGFVRPRVHSLGVPTHSRLGSVLRLTRSSRQTLSLFRKTQPLLKSLESVPNISPPVASDCL